MALLDQRNVQNAITQIPYANVRTLVCGWGPTAADDSQIKLIQMQVEQGMDEGACGLSTGLDYAAQCYASTAELVAACLPMAEAKGLYVTHMRYKTGTLPALKEAVEIGRRAGVPVHISHLKAANEADTEAILSYVDQVAVNEVDFSFDVYPYLPGSTLLNYLLPYEIWQDGPLDALPKLRDPAMRAHVRRSLQAYAPNLDAIRIAWLPGKENSCYQGKTLAEYVEDVRKAPEDALCDLLIEENLAVLLVFFKWRRPFCRPIPGPRLLYDGNRRCLPRRGHHPSSPVRVRGPPAGDMCAQGAIFAGRCRVEIERRAGYTLWVKRSGQRGGRSLCRFGGL